MENQYGLDSEYFKKKLKSILKDIDVYSPTEMFRDLSRLSLVAADQDDITVEIKVKNLHRHINRDKG